MGSVRPSPVPRMTSDHAPARGNAAPVTSRLTMAEDARANDASLVTRIRDGDITAFEELYRSHASRLFNVAWRMLSNAADAEDALQEVFLQAYRRIGTYR